MSTHIRDTKDLGFFIPTSREHVILYNKVRKEKYPLNELYDLVELAGIATTDDIPILEKALKSIYPDMRYWAAVGLAKLGTEGKLKSCPLALLR